MNKFKSELKLLVTCQPVTARILFKRAPKEFIRAVVDATWTTLAGKLNLSAQDKDEVRSVQPALQSIASRGQTLGERRQLLSTSSCIKAISKLFSVLQTYF